jgi:phosphoribosylformylglycinamidine synthase
VTTAYGVPCISGKDSMKNDSTRGGQKISIPPTVLFSTIARIDRVQSAVTMDFKRAGDFIYVAGWTRDELGASEYHRLLARRRKTPDVFGGHLPGLNPEAARGLYQAMGKAHAGGWLHSSHTPTLGGLAVAWALAALGGRLGADIDLASVPVPDDTRVEEDARLFSESNSRFVLTCSPEDAPALEAVFSGLPLKRVGTVTADDELLIRSKSRIRIRKPLARLLTAFQGTLWNL